MACEFLVLNGAKINAIDADGNTALHLAALHGSTGQVWICFKINLLDNCKNVYTKVRLIIIR